MGLGVCLKYTRLVLLDICLNLFNLILSFININHFLQTKETVKFGYLSLFLMWFPGFVTSVGFLITYFRGVRAISELEVWKLVVYPLALLILYPALPLLLTIYYLFKNQDIFMKRARLARLFAAFLDHGPQFVLRVVVVVLNGLPHRGQYGRDDSVFILSMVLSFLSLVLSALVFNERQTSRLVWLFVSAPMFAAIFGGRAFTLAVLVREVLEDGSLVYQQLLCVIFILVIVAINIGLFRWCGQDWIRSIVFSLSSLLIPAGYTNDPEYYQLPNQNLLEDQTKVRPAPRLRREFSTEVEADSHQMGAVQQKYEVETDEKLNHLVPMNSGKYLLSHILSETLLLGVCSFYVWLSSDTSKATSEALVLPQVLCVIPGLMFGVSRSILHFPSYDDNDTASRKACGACQTGVKICLTATFAFLGFCSVVPAVLWTFIYKLLDFGVNN